MPFNHREIVLPVEIEEEQSRSALTFLKIYRSELELFFQLLERQPVADLLARDRCCNYADSYLLATVLVYFKRAGLALAEYTVENFWLCLYLAHDQEEDEEELKWELLPWALGPAWRNHSLPFFQAKDTLWRRMAHRSLVSRKQCEQVMSLSRHAAWTRHRHMDHAGAVRRPADEDYAPRGPNQADWELCTRCSHSDTASHQLEFYLVSDFAMDLQDEEKSWRYWRRVGIAGWRARRKLNCSQEIEQTK